MTAYSNTKNDKSYTNAGQQDPMGKEGHMQYPPKTYHPAEPGCNGDDTICATLPDLKRLNYFYGQMLGVADFQTEQHYFREKLKLHNRCLHGYGVVCGLGVVPEPYEESCVPKGDEELKQLLARLKELEVKRKELKVKADGGDQAAATELQQVEQQLEELRRKLEEIRREECDPEMPTRVVVECGFALDCEGNELIVRQKFPVDLWRYLNRADRERVTDGEHTLYLSICYCQQPTDPARPVLPDSCGASSECNYGKYRDSVKVRVTADLPDPDQRCATCCEGCCDPCVLLARIDNFYRGWPLEPEDIHNEARRPVSTYQFTTINGISWTDGAEYTENEAEALLGVNPQNLPNDDPGRPTGYLMVTFSRPILTSSIKPGVIDLWSIQGGAGRAADIFNLAAEYVDLPDPAQEPTVDRIRFRTMSDESPNPSDRVMITIRASRLIDECCRPVDGAFTRVAFIDDEEFEPYQQETEFAECVSPPPFGYGPWSSGTGSPGANFESWFYIKANERPASKQAGKQASKQASKKY